MWPMKSQILISDEPHAGSNPIFYALKRRKPAIKAGFLNMVGEEGFEPPTLWSQTRCATKLRYSPRCLTENLSPSTDAYITDSQNERNPF